MVGMIAFIHFVSLVGTVSAFVAPPRTSRAKNGSPSFLVSKGPKASRVTLFFQDMRNPYQDSPSPYGHDYWRQDRRDTGMDPKSPCVMIGGDSLETWTFPQSSVEGVQVVLKNDGGRMYSELDLWEGPYSTPQRMEMYSEDGKRYPFCSIIETPSGQHSLGIRNNGQIMQPIMAGVKVDDSPGPAANARPDVVEGGCVRSFTFPPSVTSVRVLVHNTGFPMDARIELVNGDDESIKQVINGHSEDGSKSPVYAMISTPDESTIIRVENMGTPDFPPLSACLEPCRMDVPPGSSHDSQEPNWVKEAEVVMDEEIDESDFVFEEDYQGRSRTQDAKRTSDFAHSSHGYSYSSPFDEHRGRHRPHERPAEDPAKFAADQFESTNFDDIYGNPNFGVRNGGPRPTNRDRYSGNPGPYASPYDRIHPTDYYPDYESPPQKQHYEDPMMGHGGYGRKSAARNRYDDLIIDDSDAHIYDQGPQNFSKRGPKHSKAQPIQDAVILDENHGE